MLTKKEEYQLKLKDPRWVKLSLAIRQRDMFKCTYCFSPDNLQVHHLVYIGEPWECPTNFLVTLCDSCHEKESVERKLHEKALLQVLSMCGYSYYNIRAISEGFANCKKVNHIDNIADTLKWVLTNPDILHQVVTQFLLSQAKDIKDDLIF